MFQEYISLYKEYSQKYGPNTAIFLAVGSFYELYDIQDVETNETQCNVRTIVDYLGIQLSTKKGDFAEKEIGLFAGFPDYVLHKWASRLTSAGWTVVVVDQHKDQKGKVKERKVSRILSPATHVEATLSTETPYVLELSFHSLHIYSPPVFGAAVMDLTTATTYTYSGTAIGRPDAWTIEMVLQLINVFSPKEILIHWRGEGIMPEEMLFRRMFGLSSAIPLHRKEIKELGSFAKEQARMEYLKKIYTIRSLLPPRSFLGLRTEEEEIALLFLLQYVEEHCPSMLHSFHRNIPWTPESRLICGNHTLQQLNMCGTNGEETIVGLYQKCLTPMGKRHIKQRLVNPLSEPKEIEARLQEVAYYMESCTDEFREQVERSLRSMYDLPRIHRRLLCGVITPNELSHLFETYSAMDLLHPLFHSNSLLAPSYSIEEWKAYQTLFSSHFDREKSRMTSEDYLPLHTGRYTDVGEIEEEIRQILYDLHQLRKEIATAGLIPEEAIRMEERSTHSNGEPYGFRASSLTLQQLKKRSSFLPQGTKISELKAGGWYSCTALDQFNSRLLKARDRLKQLWNRYILPICNEMADAGQTLWTEMEQWICHLDATQCIGVVSKKWGFVRPTILPFEKGESSMVSIQQIRHPLVELASPHLTFIKNDITLDDSQQGLLIYGLNSAGKSTTAKSLGIAVLLAQCGAYVPATAMTLRPFQALYSRIHNNDQLFAGLSSFSVEMSELRTILHHATPYTLVITDEMANGTESTSATAIVAASIQWLSQRGTKFVSATHLHDLPQYLDKERDKIAIKHLHVEYHPVTQKLIYHRILREGQGSNMYGVEVARYLDLPHDFIEQALTIRHRIIGSTTQQGAKASAWNASLVRKECERCKHPIVSDLEVHHVQHRSTANKTGHLADGTHMNHASNLMVICQTCHDELHRGTFEVGPVQQTSDGPERVMYETMQTKEEPGAKKHSKWTEEELEIIRETLLTYKTLSLKALRTYLHSTHGISMSETLLGKLRKEIKLTL